MDIESAIARFSDLFLTKLIGLAFQTAYELCHIRRTYIHIRHSGRAWQPSPTRKLRLVDGSHFVRADTAVRPYAEDLSLAALATHQTCSNHQTHTHRQYPKLTRDHIDFREACHHQRDHHRNRNAGHYPRDNRGNHAISLPESPLPGIFSL